MTHTTTRASALARRRLWLLVAALIISHYVLALTAVSKKGNTFDELAHLTAGYSHWLTGDFRLVPEHPPLASMWAALPLRFMSLRFPSFEQAAWWSSNQWSIGSEFFFGVGNDPAKMLLASRAMALIFSAATALAVFCWSRSLWSSVGGFISLALFVFCPTMLANGPLVTTDAASGLFFLLATWSIWWALRSVRPASVILSGLALAGLLLSKMSALLIVPIYLILLIVRLVWAPHLELRAGAPKLITKPLKRLAIHASVIALQAIIVVPSIWAMYGFRNSAFVGAEPGRDRFAVREDSPQSSQSSWDEELAKVGGSSATLIRAARDHHLLPEAYLYGLAFTLDMTQGRDAFLNGERSREGFWSFFPICFLYKTPLALFALLLIAAGAWLRSFSARGGDKLEERRASPAMDLVPLIVLIGVYAASAVGSRFNIGHRHLLPLYPPLYILAGAAGRLWRAQPSARYALSGVLALHAATSLWTWPNYLAYFNLIAGGPKNGYRHLVDSSLDWGQDLPALLQELMSGNHSYGNNYSLAYWGTDSPEHHGVKGQNLLTEPGAPTSPTPLRAGDYFISASRLQQMEVLPISRWTTRLESLYQPELPRVRAFQDGKTLPVERGGLSDEFLLRLRFARFCATLRHRDDFSHVGYSILTYLVKNDEIETALFGPPPESVADTAEGLLRLGDELVSSGANTPAAACYEEAVRINPRLASAHEHLGTLMLQSGAAAQAEQHFREALLLNPKSCDAAFNLGQILLSRGKIDEGLEIMQTAAAIRPDWPSTHLILAGLWEARGREDKVIEELEEALRLDPRLTEARKAQEKLKTTRQSSR